jgi:hypothetical protein
VIAHLHEFESRVVLFDEEMRGVSAVVQNHVGLPVLGADALVDAPPKEDWKVTKPTKKFFCLLPKVLLALSSPGKDGHADLGEGRGHLILGGVDVARRPADLIEPEEESTNWFQHDEVRLQPGLGFARAKNKSPPWASPLFFFRLILPRSSGFFLQKVDHRSFGVKSRNNYQDIVTKSLLIPPFLRPEGDEGLDEHGRLSIDVRADHDLGAVQGLVVLERENKIFYCVQHLYLK